MSRKCHKTVSRRAPSLPAAAVVAIVAVLGVSPASARERPTSFERDYETAEELDEFYEALEAADLLTALDITDDAIVAFGCPDEHRAYSEALAEVTKLAERARAGEYLTNDEKLYYRDQKSAEEQLWEKFEECYSNELRHGSLATDLPPEIDSHADLVATYERLREEHGWHRDEGFDAVAEEVEEEIERIESEPAYIATVTKVFHPVQITLIRRGDREILPRGAKLMVRDVIRTGRRSRVTFELHDRIEEKDAGPTVVSIGPSTEIEIEKVSFRKWKQEARWEQTLWQDHLIDVIRGKIRAFTKGMSGQAAFNVRVGTSLCGSRGTEFEIEHLPELDETTYTVHSGLIEITTPNGKVSLDAGWMLRVTGGVPGQAQRIPAQS